MGFFMRMNLAGISVGHHTDLAGATGCTVILAPGGATASVEVRGGAPGTRETDLLSPHSTVDEVHAILLTGGSAFGLAAATGVVRFLEERGYGYDTPYARVPLVPAAVIYDLGIGSATARVGEEGGYLAAMQAGEEVEEGSVGVGTGATVGKVRGEEGWMKGGFGVHRVGIGDGTTIVAFTVVNAFGDVVAEDGSILAGARGEDQGFLDTRSYLLSLEGHPRFERGLQHTTLSVVVTDAGLTKTECRQVARMAHDGMARAVSPVHTPVDGDAVFVLSLGGMRSNLFQLGAAAADATAGSIRRAVARAGPVGGIPALGPELES